MSKELLRRLREAVDQAERQRAIDEMRKASERMVLREVSLANCDLSGLNLICVDMEKVDLRGAACRNVQFSHLTDCVLDGIDAFRSTFPRLNRCRFQRAALVEAHIGGRLSGCDFSEAVLRLAQIGPVLSPHRHEYGNNCFDGADLRGVDAIAAHLPGTSFKGAQLTDARLSRSNLSGCDLRNTRLTGANITRACLTGAAVTDAVFHECVLTIDQANELRAVCPHHTNRLRIVSHAAGPKTATLEQELEVLAESRLGWCFHPKGTHPAQKIMITNGGSDGRLWGYAFQSDTSEFIRMYPMDEGGNSLSSILLCMAADYADWQVDSRSIEVQVGSAAANNRVIELLCGMMIELFVVA